MSEINCSKYGLNIGDQLVYAATRYRRWWQFWKPRSWKEANTYTIVDVEGMPRVLKQRDVHLRSNKGK